jgi:hypothetical protein
MTTKSTASRHWRTVLLCVGVALIAGVLVGLILHRRSAPRRSIEDLVAKNVVISPPETADAHLLSGSDVSPLAKIRVQNPRGAITFVLELKKTVEEFYEEGAQAWKRARFPDEFSGEGTQLHFGVARIHFETDTKVATGDQSAANSPLRFKLEATLMAKGEHSNLADWANAHLNLRKTTGHVLRCDLVRLPPALGSGFAIVNQRSSLSRGKVDGKLLWITVAYGELGVSSGQSVGITFMDQGNAAYNDGEQLPSFRIKLQ